MWLQCSKKWWLVNHADILKRLELIFFTWRQVIHLSTWKIESSWEQSERILYYWSESCIKWLQSHVYTNNLFNVYVTQVKSREEKSYSIQSHSIFSSCTFLFHHIFLCSMNDNYWVKECSSTYVTIMSITNAKRTSFIFKSKIESRHHCIKYHQWRAKQRWCIIIKQHKHSHQEFTWASHAE